MWFISKNSNKLFNHQSFNQSERIITSSKSVVNFSFSIRCIISVENLKSLDLPMGSLQIVLAM